MFFRVLYLAYSYRRCLWAKRLRAGVCYERNGRVGQLLLQRCYPLSYKACLTDRLPGLYRFLSPSRSVPATEAQSTSPMYMSKWSILPMYFQNLLGVALRDAMIPYC